MALAVRGITDFGFVKQSLTHLNVPRSHKPMMHKFGTTP